MHAAMNDIVFCSMKFRQYCWHMLQIHADSCFSSWIWTDVLLLRQYANSSTVHGSARNFLAQQFRLVNLLCTKKKVMHFIHFSFHSPIFPFFHQTPYISPAIRLGISNWRRYLVAHGPWDRIARQLPSTWNTQSLRDKDQHEPIWTKIKAARTKHVIT